MNKGILLGYLFLSAGFSIVANIFGKRWSLNPTVTLLVITLILFVPSGFFYLLALRYGKLGVAAVAWDAITSLGIIAIGWLIFKETLTFNQGIGVLLILVGQYLLLR